MTNSDTALKILITDMIEFGMIQELKDLAKSMIRVLTKDELHKCDYDNFVKIEYYLLSVGININHDKTLYNITQN